MYSHPKVTIGLCVRNAALTVKAAVKSILKQDYPYESMDVIIVDGYSQDNTLLIIEELLAKSDLRYMILRENIGLGYARQLVVGNTNSKYIIWVDGDIILPRDHVTKQVRFMEKNPNVGIGRAKYALLSHTNSVAFLENIPFVVECLKYGVGDEVSLDISGTPGSIFRVEAIRQVGGFDTSIKGAGEDTDLAYRIKAAGWRICLTPATFYAIFRSNWRDLWNEYFWWGYGAHYNFHKIKRCVKLYNLSPIAGFLAGLYRLPTAYILSRRKVTILLPVHYAFKRVAWCCGFTKADIDDYGHN